MPFGFSDRSMTLRAVALAVMMSAALGTSPASAAKPADFGTSGNGVSSVPGSLQKPGARVASASAILATSAVANTQLCTAFGDQTAPFFVADGNGGGIATWADNRDGHYDVYLQKLDASGVPSWAGGGVPACKVPDAQINPQLVVDGTGGAIVVWEDARTDPNNPDIYAQRLSAAGVELWQQGGVLVCGESGGQRTPVVAADGIGGVMVVWTDTRNGNQDLYAQHLNGAGAPQWPASGVAVCTAAGTQEGPSVVSDANGGVIVSWRDLRGADADLYAQRVTSAGVAVWAADGVPVAVLAGDVEVPALTADGAGGAIAAWGDARSGNLDVYAQRLSGAGAALWTANGVGLCVTTGAQQGARLCQDGANGAIVVWEDRRGANADIYARRVDAAGAPQWTANGVVVCNAAADQTTPAVVADPMGGAIFTWSDARTGANGKDVYVQRLSLAGSVSWTANGQVVCDTAGDQVAPAVVSDGVGGAQVAWRDFRAGATADLYAQRVEPAGTIPAQCATNTLLSPSVVVTASVANSYYTFDQFEPYWAGVGVRPSSGTDWDLEVYEGNTFGGSAYPICFEHPYAGSYLSSGADYIITNFNDGHSLLTQYSVRATRYSGASTAAVEWDDDIEIATKDCTSGSCGANSKNNWTGVLDVYDIFLFAGQSYTFDFTKTGSADIKMALFSSGSTTGPYFQPRTASEFETTNRFTTYVAQYTTWYGLVFVNDNGIAGTYAARINTGQATGIGDPPPVVTGLRGMAPNPARGAVRIQFGLERPAEVAMRVLDMAGRRVSEIPRQRWGAGAWSVTWDGHGSSGRALAPGMYYVEMIVDGRRVGQSRLALLR